MSRLNSYDPDVEQLDELLEEHGWQAINEGYNNLEYEHPYGGRFQLNDVSDESISGVVYHSDNEFIVWDTEHEYFSDVDDKATDELSILKNVEIPRQDYQSENIEELVSSITDIFEGTDYNLSEITR